MTDDLANLGAALAKRSGAEHGLTILQPHLDRTDRVFQAACLATVSGRDNPVTQIPGAPATATTGHRERTNHDNPLVHETMRERQFTAAAADNPPSVTILPGATAPRASSGAPKPPSGLLRTTMAPAASREALTAAPRALQAHITQPPPIPQPPDRPRTPQAPIQEQGAAAYPAQLGATGQAAPQTTIAETPATSVAPVDFTSQRQTGAAGDAEPQLYSAPGLAGQITSHASSRWQPPIPHDIGEPGAANQSSQTGEADGQSEGRLILDNGLLGRWVIDHISHAADRPATGSTGFDPRISRTWPGALQSL